MEEDKKYTYKGKEYTHSELQSKYGDKTEEAISKFGFTEVNTTPVSKYTYNNKTYTREELESKYGNDTDKAISKFGFKEVGVKKKELTSSDLSVQNKGSESILENGSTEQVKHKEGTLAWNQAKMKQYNPNITSLLDNFNQAKVVSDDDKKAIEQSVDDAINQSGFWNNVMAYGKKGYNALVDTAIKFSGVPISERGAIANTFKAETNPLYAELKEVDEQVKQVQSRAKQENKPIPTFTDKDKTEEARKLKIAKEISFKSDSQVRDALKSMDPESKKSITIFQTGELASFSEKEKFNLEKQNLLRSQIDNLQARASEFVEAAKTKQPTEDELKEFESLQNTYQKTITEAISVNEERLKNQDVIGNAKDNLDVFKRDYGWLKNFMDNAGATGLDLTAGLLDFANWSSSALGTGTDKGEKNVRQLSKLITETATDVRQGIAKPISVDGIKTMDDFGGWFWNTAVASQIPIYAAVVTGAPGIAALGVSATGSKYEEMRTEEDDSLVPVNYSYAQKALVPLGYGASETVSALVDRMLIMNAGRVIKSATSAERQLFAKGMWNNAFNGVKETARGALYEGLDESATEVMQNVLDKFVLGKDVGLLDNVKDAAAAGAIMGAMIPVGARVVASGIKPFSVDNKIQKINSEIIDLENALNNTSLQPSSRAIIEGQLNDAKKRNIELLESKTKEISEMTNDEFDAIRRIERTQANIRSQAKGILADESIEKSMKDQIVSNLKKEFEAQENERVLLLKGDVNAKLNLLGGEEVIRLKDQASRELMQEKNPNGDKEITIEDEEISKRAFEIYESENSQSITDETLSNEEVNEATPNENTLLDEDVQSGIDEMGEVRGEPQDGSPKEGIDEGVSETNNNRADRKPKVETIKTSSKGKEHSVTIENGEITFRDKNGNEPSRETKRKLQREYAKLVDFTEGTEADLSLAEEGVTANAHIAANSQNASQIAEAISLTSREEYHSELDYKQRMIAENLGAVSRESFVENGDANYITQGIALQYFGKKGEGRSLDVIAKEISEISGIEVTEQDIVDFIVENPRGKKDFLDRNMKEDLNALKSAFTDATGLPATNEFLELAQSQKNNKEKYGSSLDYMDDNYFVNLENEINQSYEQESESGRSAEKATDIGREGSDKIEDTKENEGGSRVRETSSERHSGSQEESGSEGQDSGGERVNLDKHTFNKLIEVFQKFFGNSLVHSDINKLAKAINLDSKSIRFQIEQSKEESLKEKQLYIINTTNPAPNTYNTWIRSIDDIKTAEEAFSDAFSDGNMYPDFTVEDMKKALKKGSVTVYSSYPIKKGNFLTPSLMNAEEYAGGGKVYSKKIKLEELAWIDESEGQYAPVDFMRTADGVIWGATYLNEQGQREIYINESALSPETLLHEVYHPFDDMMFNAYKEGDKHAISSIKRLNELAEQNGYLESVQNNPSYANKTLEEQKSEARVQMIGEVGNKQLDKSFYKQLESAVLDALKWLSDKLGISIKDYSPEQILNLNLEDIVKASLSSANKGDFESKINLSRDLKINDFISNIDKMIDNLDKFGKENLSMGLPLVVARQGLQAMKLAAKTAKSVADIISAGLNAVQQTDWYKNLSKAEQTDIDNNFIDYLNKPYETNKNTRGREKIEKEIQEALNNGQTESQIIDSYTDRMEKMMAKDYFERNKAVDPKDAKKQVDDAFEKSEKKMEELTNPKFDINKLFRNFITTIADRQFLPKFLLNKAGGRLVRNYIITAKGASGYAKYMYDKAYDKIYKGLSSDQIKLLDKVIQLRRFIAIDENRSKNGLPAVVHPDYINDNVAKSYLHTLENELGSQKFDDLMKRADSYFETFKDLLDQMMESGIISKESRDRFFDVDYQPREFLEFLENKETETAHLDNGSTGGLGKDQIQKLEKGLDSALVTDSQYLLSRALNVRAKTIAMNNTTSRFADFMKEQAEKVELLKKKNNPTKKEKETIKYFEQLQKRVKDNPIIGFTESGNPIYKHKKTPNGFSNAYYWVDGIKHNLLMEDEFHSQYFDALKKMSNETKEKWAMRSGTGLVKSIATGNNPTFFITNTPRDFLFIATFSEEYGVNFFKNMILVAKDAALGIRDIKQENDTYRNFVKFGGMTDFLMDQGKFKGTTGMKAVLSKFDNKTKERWGKFLDYATLQKLQVYSEIGFRMGVFNRSIKNQLKGLNVKSIQDITDKKQLEDIYTNAASAARSIMDFNQGGTFTKDADAIIPYLNAATQGTRVMLDNWRERPIETTLRVTQAAAFVAPIPIGISLMFLSGTDKGDDEKDMSSVEIYNKALKGVSKFDRSNYFIIFNGKRTASGEFEYYRIAKAQQLTPFFTVAEGVLQKTMKASVGDSSSGTLKEDLDWIIQNNISPFEFGLTDNIARNPLVKGALSYSTGYDFFREQDISYMRGKVPASAEGYESKSVEDFYKEIGMKTGWSPARTKAAVESIITTPSTSPYIGMIYGGMDAVFSDKDTEQLMQKFAKDMAKSSVNRVVKETSEFNRRISKKKEIQDAMEKNAISKLNTKFKFNSLVSDLKEGKINIKEINEEINKLSETDTFEAKRISKRVRDQLKNKDTPAFVFEVKYTTDAKDRALLLADKLGDALLEPNKMQERERKIAMYLKKHGVLNEETMMEYKKLVK